MNTQKMEDMITLLKKAQRNEGTYDEFQKMIDYLNKETSKSYAKLNGKQDLQKAIDAMVSKNDYRPIFTAPFIVDGITYASDTYQAVRIKNTKGLRILENVAVKNGVTPPKMEPLFNAETDTIEELPDLGTIEKYIKSAKALYKSKALTIYKLSNGTFLNAVYLKNAIMATGNNLVYYNSETTKYPVIMKSEDENVTTLTCPINPETWAGIQFDKNGFAITKG